MIRLIFALVLIPCSAYAQNVEVYVDEFSGEQTVTAGHILPLEVESYSGTTGIDAACFTASHKCVIRVIGLDRSQNDLQGSASLRGVTDVQNLEVGYIDQVPHTSTASEVLVFIMPFSEFDLLESGAYLVINGERIELSQRHISLLNAVKAEYNAIMP